MTDKSSHGTHFKVNHETDYTMHKAFPWHSSQSIPGDRLHQDGQIFPWSPSRSTRRQTTNMQTSLPLVPLSKYQGTDYTKDGQIFPWSPFWSTRRQTTNMQTSLPLVLLSNYQGTDYTRNIEALILLAPLLAKYQGAELDKLEDKFN